MWGWYWIVAIILGVIGSFVFAKRRPKRLEPESLFIVAFDERRITVTDPRGQSHSVQWEQISRVGIRTTDEGPFLPDVFWGIHAGAAEPAIVFPGGATGESELLAQFQRRLAGFDNDQVIAAMGSTENAFFVPFDQGRRATIP